MNTTTDISIESLADRTGQRIGTSSWFTIDQARIDEFARCTDDPQWIHVDVERAANESPFGGTIAHGFLTLSLLAPTLFDVLVSQMQLKQAVNYGLEKVRFIAPVRAGKRVRNHIAVVSIDAKGDGRHLLRLENTLEIEGENKPALLAHSIVMLIA